MRQTDIYVVNSGDTIFGIARSYGVQPRELIWLNQIELPDQLAVGQSLLIPDAGVDIERPMANVLGFAYPHINGRVLMETLPYLTDLAIFSYHFTENGGLIQPFADDLWMIQMAKENGVRPVLTLTSIGENGSFQPGLTNAMLKNRGASQRLIENLYDTMLEKGYEGINVDLENVYAEDAGLYAEFLEELTVVMHQMGWIVSVDLAPKLRDDQPGLLYEGIDYAQLGAVADQVFLMTYEWGHSSGPPMAVAPLNMVRRVVEYALSKIPKEKILMGIPNYGYDWTLPFVPGGMRARSLGNIEAVHLAARKRAEIRFDELAQSPYFYYTENGTAHQVWFEDVRSINAKFSLVKEYQLEGFGYWQIMRMFRANWVLSQRRFQRRLGD